MPQIYCAYQDCENNEDELCCASAIRLDPKEGCLTYAPYESVPSKEESSSDDSLTWDEEYFEYEFLDDEGTL